MPVKNFWSLEAGEAMFAEALQRKLRGWEIFFPIKDVGVDLLAVSGIGTETREVLTFQVKESKAFDRRERDITPMNTAVNWFTLDPEKVRRFQPRVNFYVFVCSHYDFNKSRKTLTVGYMTIPSEELVKRLSSYKPSTEKRWVLFLCVEQNGRCLDWRSIGRKNKENELKRPERDYSRFLKWESIVQP